MVVAGRRWGKTVLACAVLFTEALKNPDGIYWLVAPTYGQAKELAWNILVKMIPEDLLAKQPHETGLSFKFQNGAEIHLKGADNPSTLRGRGLRGLVIDEVAAIRNHKSVWEEILRPSLTDYQGFCLFISTPKGKDYFWELFLRGQRHEGDYESWQFKTEDNPHIARSEIKEAKESTNERFFRQEYEASFEDFTGLVYPEFTHKTHVIEPREIPAWWEKVGSIDPAITGTTAALYGAVDETGAIYITGEFYDQNRRVSEVSDSLRGKSERWYIDPSSQRRDTIRDGKLYSMFDEFADNGIFPVCAENDLAGINRVAEYFKSNRLYIFSNCKNLIMELERYHWSEERESTTGMITPKPYKVLDHACDCLRYLVMSRAQGSKQPKPRSKDRAIPLAGELLTIDDKEENYEKWITG